MTPQNQSGAETSWAGQDTQVGHRLSDFVVFSGLEPYEEKTWKKNWLRLTTEAFKTVDRGEQRSTLPLQPTEPILPTVILTARLKTDPSARSTASFEKVFLSAGTLSDRIAALVLLVQRSPVHNLKHLDSLVNMAAKKSRREALMTIDALKDLFVQELLPDRKLIDFRSRPLDAFDKAAKGDCDSERRLVLYHFESELKKRYATFTRALLTWCHDTVEVTRIQACRVLLDLLIAKPEQEQFLLSTLVNKFGDTSVKVSTQVRHLLARLLHTHPNMTAVVVNEVEKLIFRKNVDVKAQFYGLCFLNQITLDPRSPDVACKLLDVYFTLFKLLVAVVELDNRMLGNLLIGINKAFGVVRGSYEGVDEHVDMLYKIAAISKFSTSLEALMLLFQVLKNGPGMNDRFYRSLYKKLLDPALVFGTKSYAFFFHLMFLALKSDPMEVRVRAFLRRLLHVCLHCPPTVICSTMLLISEIARERKEVFSWRAGPPIKSELLVDDEERFVDAHGVDSDRESVVSESDAESKNTSTRLKTSSWVHKQNLKAAETRLTRYDPFYREPSFCGVQYSQEFEFELLLKHYHPSAVLFAKSVLQESVNYPGNPLQDFSLTHFLERFVFKNPKTLVTDTDDVKKPVSKRRSYDPWGVKRLPVISDQYAKQPADKIPADEKFIHKFMASRFKLRAAAEEAQHATTSDEEYDETIGNFEQAIQIPETNVNFSQKLRSRKQKAKKRRQEEDETESDQSYEEDHQEEDATTGEDRDYSQAELENMMKKASRLAMDEFAGIMDEAADATSSDEENGGRDQPRRKAPKQGKFQRHRVKRRR